MDKWTQTFHAKFQKAFIFLTDICRPLCFDLRLLNITTLTTLKYLSQFYLHLHSCSLLHEQDFSGVIQTGIKCFTFHRINISSRAGQDHHYIHLPAQKKQITFFHCLILLYLCGWEAVQNNLTLASKFHLLCAQCWYKRQIWKSNNILILRQKITHLCYNILAK